MWLTIDKTWDGEPVTEEESTRVNLHVVDGVAYLANWGGGLHLVDVSDETLAGASYDIDDFAARVEQVRTPAPTPATGTTSAGLMAKFSTDGFSDPLFSALVESPLLLRMVEAGQLGKKSGKGFYTY